MLSNASRLDKTVRIFNEFYSFDTLVKSNEYDVIKSFFLSVTKDDQIADNFTVFLFKISQETGINVMELLTQLDGNSEIDINKIVAYYMNSFKSKTSLYGVAQIPQPNMSVYRNVIQ
jgi:hypothetical protein